MHLSRPGRCGPAATLLAFAALPLQGCATAPASPAAWGFISLALVGLTVLAFTLGRLLGARRPSAQLRRARDEARDWQGMCEAWTWRCDVDLGLLQWQAPAPHGAGVWPAVTALRPQVFAPVAVGGPSLEDTLARGQRFSGLGLRCQDAAMATMAGGSRWLLAGSPLHDEHGALAGFAGTARLTDALDASGLAARAFETLLAATPAALLTRDAVGWTLRQINPALSERWPSARPGAALSEWLPSLPAGLQEASQRLQPGQQVEVEAWRLMAFDLPGGLCARLWLAPALAPPMPQDHGDVASFSFTVTHDLRAPIRVVEGFTRIVKEDYGSLLDRVGNDHLDRVLGAAARMNLMIDAMLTLARLSSQPLARQPVDLSQLASYVVEDLTRGTPERVVEIEIEPGLSAQGDPTLLRLVLENLLGNAWKYSARCVRSQISFRRRKDGDGLAFEVRDNGAGFDMRSADRLFGLFQRLHSANEFPGHGVGLASVKRIVRRHGGDIRAESEPGRGAAFIFTLAA